MSVSTSHVAIGVVAAVGVLTLLSGCSLFTDAQPEQASTATTATTLPPVESSESNELSIDLFNDGVFCDGTDQRAALIFDADPGETISFESPMPVTIPDGVADDQGTYQLLWTCEDFESALSWDITATAAESRRSVVFKITGVYTDPAADRLLVYTPETTTFPCDGIDRTIGYIEQADPFEPVAFEVNDTADPGDNTAGLLDDTANAEGRVEVTWGCQPEDAGQPFSIRAAGRTSGRSVTFKISGEPPVPLEAGPIAVAVLEDPFICDRQGRPVALLSNLTPGVQLTFEASPTNGAIDQGRAGADGELAVNWVCERSQDGTNWTITATEQQPSAAEERSVSFTFGGAATPNPTTITFVEDPFICDGISHQVATLFNFLPNEFIDFTSPQTEGLRQGQAGNDGRLAVRWQCTSDDVGRQWEVTATGATSGVDITFTITGAAAEE